MTLTSLYMRLLTAYPQHQFDLTRADSVGAQDDPSTPEVVIVFNHDNECIVDPLTCGFYPCDPLATYGLSPEDAAAIRAYNNIVAG